MMKIVRAKRPNKAPKNTVMPVGHARASSPGYAHLVLRKMQWTSLMMMLFLLSAFFFALVHMPTLLIERTSSMSPLIVPGDLVLARPVHQGMTPQVGEIASYNAGSMLITHRIIGVTPSGAYIFKGDANPTADPYPVARNEVRDIILTRVPQAGSLLEAITSLPGKLVILLLLVLVTLGMLHQAIRSRGDASKRFMQPSGNIFLKPRPLN